VLCRVESSRSVSCGFVSHVELWIVGSLQSGLEGDALAQEITRMCVLPPSVLWRATGHAICVSINSDVVVVLCSA